MDRVLAIAVALSGILFVVFAYPQVRIIFSQILVCKIIIFFCTYFLQKLNFLSIIQEIPPVPGVANGTIPAGVPPVPGVANGTVPGSVPPMPGGVANGTVPNVPGTRFWIYC